MLQNGDGVPVRPRALLTVLLVAGLWLPAAAEAGRSLGAPYAAARRGFKRPVSSAVSKRSRGSRPTGSLVRRPSSRGVSRGQARISFPRGATGIPARVVVNGIAAGNFIVDTGATSVAISTSFARRIGLDLRGGQSITVMTASGPERAVRAQLSRVELQGAVAEDVEIVVMNDPGGPGTDGLLGLSFLSRFHMSLDAHEGILELRAP